MLFSQELSTLKSSMLFGKKMRIFAYLHDINEFIQNVRIIDFIRCLQIITFQCPAEIRVNSCNQLVPFSIIDMSWWKRSHSSLLTTLRLIGGKSRCVSKEWITWNVSQYNSYICMNMAAYQKYYSSLVLNVSVLICKSYI